jgi:hypothetical protein
MQTKPTRYRRTYPVANCPGVFVRALTVNESREVFDAVAACEGNDDFAAKKVISLTACTEAGEPIFSGPDDAEFEQCAKDLLRELWDAATSVNRLTDPKGS